MGHLSLTNSAAVHLWVQVAALYVLARLLGLTARRLGQPEVAGSLLAGVILGPSVLGAAWPAAKTFMLPQGEGAHLLGAVSAFCLLIVLIVLGAETDLPLLRRLGRAVAAVSIGSIVVPLAVGALVAYAFASVLIPGDHVAGAILLGGALGVSSLPIIARLVVELGVARRDFGQLAFASATVNDVYGFLLLVGVAVATRSSGVGGVALPIGGLLVLLLVFASVGQPAVDRLLRRVRAGGPNPVGSVSAVVGLALTAAALMQAMHVEAALGAFFAGVAVGRSRFGHNPSMRQLESFSNAIFAPIYFASAGLQVDLATLHSSARLTALVSLLAAAVASKAIGTALGARAARLQPREVGALAVLLNGRGAMQVIIGTAGLRMGLLSNGAYTVLLVVSIVSSLAVAPALRRLVGGWPGSELEQERLAREQRLRGNVLVRGQRLLVPLTAGRDSEAAAVVLDRAWPPESELTLLTLDEDEPPSWVSSSLQRPARELTRNGHDPLAAVLAEANLGYGVIGIGAGARDGRDGHLGAFTEALLNTSPLPVVLVHGADRLPRPSSLRPPKLAVAVTGTTASRAAEEIAFGIADSGGLQLEIVHVVPGNTAARAERERGELGVVGDAVLAAARRRSELHGVESRVHPRVDARASDGLLAFTREQRVDLLVLGTRLRRVEDSPFLGHTVENLLAEAETAIVVVALPETPTDAADEPYADRAHT